MILKISRRVLFSRSKLTFGAIASVATCWTSISLADHQHDFLGNPMAHVEQTEDEGDEELRRAIGSTPLDSGLTCTLASRQTLSGPNEADMAIPWTNRLCPPIPDYSEVWVSVPNAERYKVIQSNFNVFGNMTFDPGSGNLSEICVIPVELRGGGYSMFVVQNSYDCRRVRTVRFLD